MCSERQVQAVVPVGAPSLGGGDGSANMGGGVNMGVHPVCVIQGGVEEVVSDSEPTTDGEATEADDSLGAAVGLKGGAGAV